MTKREVIKVIKEGHMDMLEAFEFVEKETDLDPAEIIGKVFKGWL